MARSTDERPGLLKPGRDSRSQRSNRRRLALQILEERFLPASFVFTPATADAPALVQITGKPGNDTLILSTQVVKGETRLMLKDNGANKVVARQPLAAGPFQNIRIEMQGLAGNDRLTNRTSFPSILDGGIGNDRLVGGPADDTLRVNGLGAKTVTGGGGLDAVEQTFVNAGRFSYSSASVVITNVRIANRATETDGAKPGKVKTGTVNLVGIGVVRVTGTATSDVLDARPATLETTLVGGLGDDVIFGGENRDRLDGLEGNDQLFGNGGNDLLLGFDGDDALVGGPGDDTLDGEAGNDSLAGGEGNDQLFGLAGDDTLEGEAGDDLADGGEGNDTLRGGEDNDTLDGLVGNDLIEGGPGLDTLRGGEGDDQISGGEGDDEISGAGGNDTLLGESGSDALDGDDGNDLIEAGEGPDFIHGGNGDDTVRGGLDIDVISGGPGADDLDGGLGDDSLDGDDDNDLIEGSDGQDTIRGGFGNDDLRGGEGVDSISGNAGNDQINGGRGGDSLFGNEGDDSLNGGDDGDTLEGGEGFDTLRGGGGNDRLFGDAGNDRLFGDAGDDRLTGGGGDDSLEGGEGNDNLSGSTGNDNLTGNEGNDSLSGEEGDDVLWGGLGDDSLAGGSNSNRLLDADGQNQFDTRFGDNRVFSLSNAPLTDEQLGRTGELTVFVQEGSLVISGPSTGGFQLTGTWSSSFDFLGNEVFSATSDFIQLKTALGDIPIPNIPSLPISVVTAPDAFPDSGRFTNFSLGGSLGLPLGLNNPLSPLGKLAAQFGISAELPGDSFGIALGSDLDFLDLPLASGLPYFFYNRTIGGSLSFGGFGVSIGQSVALAFDPTDPSLFLRTGDFAFGGSLKGYIPFVPVQIPQFLSDQGLVEDQPAGYGNLFGRGAIDLVEIPITISGEIVVGLNTSRNGAPLGISGNMARRFLDGDINSLSALFNTATSNIFYGVNGAVGVGYTKAGFDLSVQLGEGTIVFKNAATSFRAAPTSPFADTILEDIISSNLPSGFADGFIDAAGNFSLDLVFQSDSGGALRIGNVVNANGSLHFGNDGLTAELHVSALEFLGGGTDVLLQGSIAADGDFRFEAGFGASFSALSVATFETFVGVTLSNTDGNVGFGARLDGSIGTSDDLYDSTGFQIALGVGGDLSLEIGGDGLNVSGSGSATLSGAFFYFPYGPYDLIGFFFFNDGFIIDLPSPLDLYGDINVSW